jgi:hypothetical protein
MATKSKNLSVEQRAYVKLRASFAEFDQVGYITSPPILIGTVEDEIAAHARIIGRPLHSRSIYFRGDDLEHAKRDTKVTAGVSVSRNDFCNFPFTKSSMSVYFDIETRRYTYTDYKNKFVLEPNQKVKLANGRVYAVTLVTATKMRDSKEFNMRKYKKIK